MGAPGVGKTRFLRECVNHIQTKYPQLLKDPVDLVVISYNHGDVISDLDKKLGVENSLSLRFLHTLFVDPSQRFENFVTDLCNAGSSCELAFIDAITMA